MTKIKLLGKLGKVFGKVYNFVVKNASQAIKALCVNFPSFNQYLYDSEQAGVGYRVIISRGQPEGIEGEEFLYPTEDVIIIAPQIQGCGGFGKILLGGALIAAAFFMPASISFFGLSITSTSVGLLGAALFVGGISTLISPTNRTPKTETEKNESYLFDKSAGSVIQGVPIPIGYGKRRLTNLFVISQSNVVEQLIN